MAFSIAALLATHALQHGGAPALGGNVDLVTDVWVVSDGEENIVWKVLGMRTGKADPTIQQ